MKKFSIAMLATTMALSLISYAGMEDEKMGNENGKRHEMREEHKAEMEAMKKKVKEICKTNKVKCEQIHQKRKQHKAEMDALINS